jgi:MscS family membrane protein
MNERLLFTRPSSRISVVFILAALTVLTLPLGAGAGEDGGPETHPLEPPDISSPEATLNTFLTEATAAIEASYVGNREAVGAHRDRMFQTLEVDVPSSEPELRALVESSLYLLEILIRIDIPARKEIPGPDLDPQRMPAYWTIPRTELRIVRIDSAVGAPPQYRFSAETVARAPEFFERAKSLPVKKRFAKFDGVQEKYRLQPGFAAPASFHRAVEALPSRWFVTLGGVPLWKWSALIILVLVGLIFFGLTHRVTGFIADRAGSTSRVTARLGALRPVVAIALIAFIQRGITDWIRLTGAERAVTLGVLSALAHLAVIWLLFTVARLVADAIIHVRDMRAYALDAQLVRLLSKLGAVLLAVYALMSLAESLGMPVAPMLAGLGVGGLAVALAVRPTLENVIGGFVLFADAPVRVGELCRFGDTLGTVEAIGLRSVRVRGIDRTVITIPNADFAQLELTNLSRRDSMLLRTTLQLRYETTPDQLRLVLVRLRELLIQHPRVLPDPARVRFVGYGSSSLDVEVFAYVATQDRNEFVAIQEDVMLRIKDIVEDAGCGFAFPSQTLYLAQSEDPDPGLAKAAEAEVACWRGENRLPFPDHDADLRRKLADTLDYPPSGSGTKWSAPS